MIVKRLDRRLWRLLCVGALALGMTSASVVPAAQAAPHSNVCSGSPTEPGVLSGTYPSNVTVVGACAVNAGAALVKGNLTVSANGALVAAFGLNDTLGSGSSSLTVKGNVLIQSGATALIGCFPTSFPCIDDPNPAGPTLSSPVRISGNLIEQSPLGVVMHDGTVKGNVVETGGGGGLSCEPSGVFALFQSPVYSDYEDSTVRGNLEIANLSSCWLGLARVHVSGNVRLTNNQLADPDAIEILANEISGNLSCQGNSRVWDSAEAGKALFPRVAKPNEVRGMRSGQCVLASAMTEGGPLGPGPF
jgi:hypothetical protein